MLTDFVSPFLAPSTILAVIGVVAFFYERRRQRIVALEKNFEVLQEFNATALSSVDNLRATIRSVVSDDTTTDEEARKIILQFMRINRMLRAWQFGYRRPKTIRPEDADEIVDNYIVTLFEAEDILDILLERGYPPRFGKYLKERLKKAKEDGRKPHAFDKS